MSLSFVHSALTLSCLKAFFIIALMSLSYGALMAFLKSMSLNTTIKVKAMAIKKKDMLVMMSIICMAFSFVMCKGSKYSLELAWFYAILIWRAEIN